MSLSQANPSSAMARETVYLHTFQHLLSSPEPRPILGPRPGPAALVVSHAPKSQSPSHGLFHSLSNPLTIVLKTSVASLAFFHSAPVFLPILEASEFVFSQRAHFIRRKPHLLPLLPNETLNGNPHSTPKWNFHDPSTYGFMTCRFFVHS